VLVVGFLVVNPRDLASNDTRNDCGPTDDPGLEVFQEVEVQKSPNGSRVAFNATGPGFGLHVRGADGCNDRRLVVTHLHHPTWLPDGRRILFLGYRNLSRGEIYVVHADGTGLKNLTAGRGFDGAPAASPDGRRIAFIRCAARNRACGLYVMNVDGSGPKLLLKDTTLNSSISWSADGTRIRLASSDDQGQRTGTWSCAVSGAGCET
jgi:TolB protein